MLNHLQKYNIMGLGHLAITVWMYGPFSVGLVNIGWFWLESFRHWKFPNIIC